jgi:protein KRI1
LRSKDPRVKDKSYRFFSEIDEGGEEKQQDTKQAKPMTLKDYHRRNILEGGLQPDEEEHEIPKTYVEEQEDLKRRVVKEMHAGLGEGDSDSEVGEGFLIRKQKGKEARAADRAPKRAGLDIGVADKDPDTFLSNFIASRAWVPNESTNWQPFDSDEEDGEGVREADEFEEAYNMRFEDPKKANEKLMAFSRETISKYSVRREEPTGRKKTRELEKARKESERQEREEEKARLKKLKMDEMKQKIGKIRKSAGLRSKDIDLEEWVDVLEADWDDEKWEAEMTRRFGEDYYEAEEVNSDEEVFIQGKRSKPKKPTWDDDIDIKDIAPDFSDDDPKAIFALSDEEGDKEGDSRNGDVNGEVSESSVEAKADEMAVISKKARLQAKAEAKKSAKRDRHLMESLVEHAMKTELQNFPTTNQEAGASGRFRYRDTSPTSFGLTPRDILFATDVQLNQFAGLKKMAAFRDEERKKKDKKKIGKKARLRQWRRDTFGHEDEPSGEFDRIGADVNENGAAEKDDGKRSKKKRKRSKSSKVTA